MTDNGPGKAEGHEVPAYFLGALLTTDIPPYLTEASGATKLFAHDPLAIKLASKLNRLPKKQRKRKGKAR